MDDFLEKIQTAFAPPPLIFGKLYCMNDDEFILQMFFAFVAKIANTRLTKICVAIFALAKRLPISATLVCVSNDYDRLYIGSYPIHP